MDPDVDAFRRRVRRFRIELDVGLALLGAAMIAVAMFTSAHALLVPAGGLFIATGCVVIVRGTTRLSTRDNDDDVAISSSDAPLTRRLKATYIGGVCIALGAFVAWLYLAHWL